MKRKPRRQEIDSLIATALRFPPSEHSTALSRFGAEILPRITWTARLHEVLRVDARPDGSVGDYLELLSFDRSLAERLVAQAADASKAEKAIPLGAAVPILGMRYVRDALVRAELQRAVRAEVPREMVYAQLGEETSGASGFLRGVFWEKLLLCARDLGAEVRALKSIEERAKADLRGQENLYAVGEALLILLDRRAIELYALFASKKVPKYVRMFVEDARFGVCAQALLTEAKKCAGLSRLN